MGFKQYQHIERFGKVKNKYLTNGTCYIFPKIDGTNSSVWLENGVIHAGSHYRELTLDNDNANFLASIKDDIHLKAFFQDYPNLRLYGEWLVPHTLKNYKDDAWNNFYVFDVVVNNPNDDKVTYLSYDKYSKILEEYNIEYIPVIKVMENPSFEQIVDCIKLNGFLTTDGHGEGIVIKNYDYYNSHGLQIWAKIVTSEFLNLKENNAKFRNALNIGNLECAIVEKYLTNAFIEKEYSKIVHENPEIQRKQLIPKLFEFVWNEFLTEEIVNIMIDFKKPNIDFKILYYFMITKIKEVKRDLFLK